MEQPPRRSVGAQIGRVLLVFGVLLLLGWILGPFLVRGGPSTGGRIRSNLRQINHLKQMWASDHSITGAVEITEQDLATLLPPSSRPGGVVVPVAGEQYRINPLGVSPEAILTRRLGKYPPGTIIRLETKLSSGASLSNPTVQRTGASRSAWGTNSTSSAAGSRR